MVVAVRPWIRVDGTLNRRVLDRLLGAALGIIMQVLINGLYVSFFPPCRFSLLELPSHFFFFCHTGPGADNLISGKPVVPSFATSSLKGADIYSW